MKQGIGAFFHCTCGEPPTAAYICRCQTSSRCVLAKLTPPPFVPAHGVRKSQAKDLLDTEQGPYIVVAMQECCRMNVLLFELKRSLLELVKGMDGQLNMTQAMEDLQSALTKNEVRTGCQDSFRPSVQVVHQDCRLL